jgi:hypothetical protein
LKAVDSCPGLEKKHIVLAQKKRKTGNLKLPMVFSFQPFRARLRIRIRMDKYLFELLVPDPDPYSEYGAKLHYNFEKY